MKITYDPAKNEGNIAKHGISLEAGWDFEMETALAREDARREYGERRFEAIGYIGERLHVMVYCLRTNAVRVISLRKANAREVKRYAET